jgi:hypothetical protein
MRTYHHGKVPDTGQSRRPADLAAAPAPRLAASVYRSAVDNVLRSPGQPLAAPLKQEMEARLGADFSTVRVHTDSAAGTSAAGVGARAYTFGSHVVIGGGADKHTLAHELTHVIQQRQGPVTGTDDGSGLSLSDPSDRFERAAEARAVRVMSGSVPRPQAAPPALQRLVGNRATTRVIQRKAYTVSREFPLETHYSLKKPDEAEKLLLGKLRADFPLPADLESTANTDKWTAQKRDQERGEKFAERKEEVLERVRDGASHYGEQQNKKMVWVPGAHVSGLSVASERDRRSTPESKLTKDVTGQEDWIGAHLIKKEWGGEDNVWNVVCWPEAAEKKWGGEFEEPIEVAFSNQRETTIDISVRVEKEDETFGEEDVTLLVQEALKKVPGENQRWRDEVQGGAIARRMTANRGLERIPVSAVGRSKLGTSTMTSTETKYSAAVLAAKEKLAKQITALATSEPHKQKTVKEPHEVGKESSDKRSKERTEGWQKELLNYRPERFERTNGLFG